MSTLITISEAAERLRVSKTTVQRLIAGDVPNRPRLPCVPLGRRKLIRLESLERYIAQAEDQQQVESRA